MPCTVICEEASCAQSVFRDFSLFFRFFRISHSIRRRTSASAVGRRACRYGIIYKPVCMLVCMHVCCKCSMRLGTAFTCLHVPQLASQTFCSDRSRFNGRKWHAAVHSLQRTQPTRRHIH